MGTDQMYKKNSSAKQAGELSNLKEEFEKTRDKPLTRVVRLRAESCCGCGCDDIIVERTVPYDSPLKNNDYIGNDVKKGDKIID